MEEHSKLSCATARFCFYDAHSTQKCAAAVWCTPPERSCCGLSSALLHSTNSSETTLPEQEKALHACNPESALFASIVRLHCGSALQQQDLHRREALEEPFPTRTSAPIAVEKSLSCNERHIVLSCYHGNLRPVQEVIGGQALRGLGGRRTVRPMARNITDD
jgi:hypothetical protein